MIIEPYAQKISHELNSGYWKVNNYCFFNKAECLRYATSIRDFKVTYHFFDHVYNTIDWTKEPTQSLDAMYRDRAQQLRDKYKHLILAFSGGADSTNVLQTFLKNNIKIDEIISYYPVKLIEKYQDKFNPADRTPENFIFEYLGAAKPMLEWIAKNRPEIKITILDSTDSTFEAIWTEKSFDGTLAGTMMTPLMSGQVLLKDYTSQFDHDTCTIHGIDVPNLTYDPSTNKFGAFFHDLANMHGHWNQRGYRLVHPKTEYFYWTTDMPELVVKQFHVVKHAVEHIARNTVDPMFNELFRPVGSKFMLNSRTDYVKKTLYPNWDTTTFQVGKLKNLFFSNYLSFLWKDPKMLDYWGGQINEFVHGVDKKFLEVSNDGRPNKFIMYGTSPINL